MSNVNQAVLKQDKKNKDFFHLYLKNVPVVYACVQEPKKKYQSEETQWSLTAFVNDATRTFLEEEVLLNKELHKVGVDKNKKKKIKYQLSSQHENGDTTYDEFEGMNGISLTLNTKKKNGSANKLIVVDKDGNEFKDLVGNGSVCTIKCFGYRNQDDLLVISLNIVQVLDLVPYEGGDGTIEDEEMGISIKVGKKESVNMDQDAGFDNPEDFDDDIPY